MYQAVNAVSSELPPLSSSSIRNFINSVRIDSRRILSRDLQSTGENDQETTIDNRARYLDELVRKLLYSYKTHGLMAIYYILDD